MHRHQVNVIAHQAVGQNAYPGLRAIRLQTLEIRAIMGVREKHLLLVNTALCDMVRHSNRHGAGKSSH
jgi:hypothetical protein